MSKALNLVLVDDEVAVHEIFSFFFKEEVEAGLYSIKSFDRGQDAIDYVASHHHKDEIFCVITDINMPGIDGFEVLENIKKKFPDIYVLMETAYDGPDFIRRAEDLNADAYFVKPLDFLDLKDKLTELSKNHDLLKTSV